MGRFTFDKRWCTKPEVLEVIRRGWNTSGRTFVTDRIQVCRKELSQWKQDNGSNSKIKIQNLRRELEEEGQKQFPNLQKLFSMRVELEMSTERKSSIGNKKVRTIGCK